MKLFNQWLHEYKTEMSNGRTVDTVDDNMQFAWRFGEASMKEAFKAGMLAAADIANRNGMFDHQEDDYDVGRHGSYKDIIKAISDD